MNRNLRATLERMAAQVTKYLLTGVLNTVLTMGAVLLLNVVLGLDFRLANGIGYLIGLANSFFWSRLWIFSRYGSVADQARKFLVVAAVCYFIQFGVLVLAVEVFHWNVVLSQLMSLLIYTVLGFVLNRAFVFGGRRS